MALALLALAAVLSPTPSRPTARLRALSRDLWCDVTRGSSVTVPVRGRVLAPAVCVGAGFGVAAHAGFGVGLPVLPVTAGLIAGGTAGLLVARTAARRKRERAEAEQVEAISLLAADIRAGRQVSDAVAAASVALRIGDGRSPISAVRAVSDRSGAPIAAVLDRVEEDVRARIHQQREIASQLAGARSTGILLAVLPLLGIALGAAMGARPLAVLFGTPAGQAALVVGVGLDALGVLWTARLVATAGGEK